MNDEVPLRWRATRQVVVEGTCYDGEMPVGQVWFADGHWRWEMSVSPHGSDRMSDSGDGLNRDHAKARLESAYWRTIRQGKDTRRKLQQHWRVTSAVEVLGNAAAAVRGTCKARDEKRVRERR